MGAPGQVEVEPQAHPLVHFIAARLAELHMPAGEMERKAGFGRSRFYTWTRGDRTIVLQNIEAALQVVGYGLRTVVLPERIHDAKLKVGGEYMTRSGLKAIVSRIADKRVFGILLPGNVSVEWNLSGKRVPAAGEDPADLVV